MAEVKIITTILLDVATAAKWFAELDDDSQARFFVEVAKHAQDWPLSPSEQWWRIGSHLKNCACSTEEAREIIRGISDGMLNGTH